MAKKRALAALPLVSIWATTAHAVPIPGLFSTGVDSSGAPLAGSSVDPHHPLIASADPAFPGPSAIFRSVIPASYWFADSTSSQCIAPATDEDYPSGGTPHPGGYYTYRISLKLAGIDSSTASITGAWGVDDSGAIQLNGVPTGIPSPSYNPLVAFSISSGLVSGINTLDFVVCNSPSSGPNPTGLRVSGLRGTGNATVGVEGGAESRELELSVPFPNPARGLARLSYTLPRGGRISLRVRDLAGRAVRTLADGSYPAGLHESTWDGLGSDGSPARAGI